MVYLSDMAMISLGSMPWHDANFCKRWGLLSKLSNPSMLGIAFASEADIDLFMAGRQAPGLAFQAVGFVV